MTTTNPSRSPGTSVFGGKTLSGIIAAAVAGSIVIGGNVFYDRSQTTIVRNNFGTGSYMTYTDAVCTNTGGLAKYTSCLISNPFSGTAALIRLQVDTNKAPTASKITCSTTQNNSTVATGANVLIRYVTTSSGGSVAIQPSGSGTTLAYAPILIQPNASIRCWHSTTPGVNLKEQIRAWLNQQYIP